VLLGFEVSLPQSYSEKLRDPRWQRKRLVILHRDNFACVQCNCTDKTLHVHHCFYEWGRDPWDYPDRSLLTLCVDCQEDEAIAPEMKKALISSLAQMGALSWQFDAISCDMHDILHSGLSVTKLVAAIHDLARALIHTSPQVENG
jgi:hypothetical protein